MCVCVCVCVCLCVFVCSYVCVYVCLCARQVLLRLWKHECKRVIADRFTSPEDVSWFDDMLARLVEEALGEAERACVDCGVDAYFVDFLRDAPEATGKHRGKEVTQWI